MSMPTKQQMSEARRLSQCVALIQPGLVSRMWLTDWRGWRFVYDTESSASCHNDCAGCPNHALFADIQPGKSKLTILTDLHPWVAEADKRLYGPERFLACKTTDRYADCFDSSDSTKKGVVVCERPT